MPRNPKQSYADVSIDFLVVLYVIIKLTRTEAEGYLDQAWPRKYSTEEGTTNQR